MSSISSYSSITINSFSSGSIIVDSSLAFTSDVSSNTIRQAINNAISSSNTLDITSLTVDSSSSDSNSQWWLPLAIALPIGVFLIFVSIICYCIYLKKRKVNYIVAEPIDINNLEEQKNNLNQTDDLYTPSTNNQVYTNAYLNSAQSDKPENNPTPIFQTEQNENIQNLEPDKEVNPSSESEIDQPESEIDQPESEIDQPESEIDLSETEEELDNEKQKNDSYIKQPPNKSATQFKTRVDDS